MSKHNNNSVFRINKYDIDRKHLKLFKIGCNLVKKIPASLRLYLLLSFLLDPFYFVYQLISVFRGKENPKRFGERWVNKKIKRPSGQIIWFHAASVGETLSLLPLIEKIKGDNPKINILVTSTTRTSAEVFEDYSKHPVIHQMAPHDTFFISKRFIKHWQPDLAVRVESEIWPRILIELKKHKVPNFLFNARFSVKSMLKIQKSAISANFLFSLFDKIHVQEKDTNEILKKIGIDCRKLALTGSLKDSREKLVCDENNFKQFLDSAKGQKIWLAACTHPGEDEVVLKAHKKIGGILLIAPRHIERGKHIKALSQSQGFSTQLRSEKKELDKNTEVYVADTMGEMGLWYSLSKAAFLGGSLVEKGGHNPLEAVQFGTFILHGSNISNAKEKYEQLKKIGVCFQVSGEEEIAEKILRLLNSNKKFDPEIDLSIDTKTALKESFLAIKSALQENT